MVVAGSSNSTSLSPWFCFFASIFFRRVHIFLNLFLKRRSWDSTKKRRPGGAPLVRCQWLFQSARVGGVFKQWGASGGYSAVHNQSFLFTFLYSFILKLDSWEERKAERRTVGTLPVVVPECIEWRVQAVGSERIRESAVLLFFGITIFLQMLEHLSNPSLDQGDF